MRYTSSQKTRGLSFVEMIIVLALFSVLSLAVMNAIASFYRNNAYTIAQSAEVDNARRGIDLLVRDIREMTYADDGAFPLAQMGEHEIGFYSDIDRDDSVEYVEYELATTTLTKRVYNATGSPPVYMLSTPDEIFTISEYVQNISQSTSTFAYYDVNGLPATPTSTVTDIRFIEVSLIVNIDPIRDPGEFLLRSSAAPRNLKDNL